MFLRSVQVHWSDRDSPLVLVHGGVDAEADWLLDRPLLARFISISTAAAGGNAALMGVIA